MLPAPPPAPPHPLSPALSVTPAFRTLHVESHCSGPQFLHISKEWEVISSPPDSNGLRQGPSQDVRGSEACGTGSEQSLGGCFSQGHLLGKVTRIICSKILKPPSALHSMPQLRLR